MVVDSLETLEDIVEEATEDSDVQVVYPVDVVLTENDSTVTITTDEELFDIVEECYGDDYGGHGHHGGCDTDSTDLGR